MFNKYYEDELLKLKQLAVEFSQANPALAPMLSGASSDPDVERLLEGVAFLTGLTRQKLDDEFPEFVQELANLLFPNFLRPVPSTTLVSFAPKAQLTDSVAIRAGIELDSVPVDGTACRFRTCCEVLVHPLKLADARLENRAGQAPALVLEFALQGITLAQWQSDSVRLFLNGAYADATKLFLLLQQHAASVRVSGSAGGSARELGRHALYASGFDTGLLPSEGHAFPGYRTVQEFFVQPNKFLFIDIVGLAKWTERGSGSNFSVRILLDQLPDWMQSVGPDDFALNITPAINVFDHEAAPISHEHRVTEYRVLPEGQKRQHYQIYSIDKVVGYQQGQVKERVYEPFGLFQRDSAHALPSYRTTLRPATVGRGADLFIAVNYPSDAAPLPETLSLRITCTNGALPDSLTLGDLSVATSSSPDRMRFTNIRTFTPAINAPVGEALLWRVIAHTSLNVLSIASAANLKSLLGLYLFAERSERNEEAANRRRIEGIEQVSATPETRLVGRGCIMRGQLISIKCRLDNFAGIGDLYLFGCVLNRFLGDYAGINSYTRVTLSDPLSGAMFTWPPRLGQQPLL